MKKLIIFCAAVLMMGACSDDNEVAPEMGISISSNGETFGIEGGSAKVVVTSTSHWRLTGKKTWCKPSVVEGESGDEITFTVEKNENPESPREITYTFMCGDKIQRYVVTQQQKDMVIFNKDSYEVSADGGHLLVEVNSNIDFEVVIPEEAKSWLSFVGTRSLQRNTLEFEVKANDTYRQREVVLDFGAKTETATRENPENENRLVIRQLKNKGIIVEDVVVPVEGGPAVMKVKSNVPFSLEVDYSYPQWIRKTSEPSPAPGDTPELVESEIRLEADATNETDGTRIGKVTCRSTDGSDIIVKGLVLQRYGEAVFLDGVTDEKFIKVLISEGFAYQHEDGRMELMGKGSSATSLISTSWAEIHDITGIEHLVKLQSLNISNNYIKRADLRKNTALMTLDMSRSGLEEVLLGDAPISEIPGRFSYVNPSLTDADRVGVETFKISGNNLKKLKFKGTSSLKSFDVTGCPLLEYLVCSDGNFEELDITNNPKLTTLDCSGNGALKKVYMKQGQREQLTTLYIGGAEVVYK